jgi:hypothetical protein
MPGFLINTPQDLDALLRAVDHPNLAAQYDLYHMARQGLDVAAGMRLLAGRIGHVQFADVPGRGAPGTGELAFPALLGALRDCGYSGWLGAEYKPGEMARRRVWAGCRRSGLECEVPGSRLKPLLQGCMAAVGGASAARGRLRTWPPPVPAAGNAEGSGPGFLPAVPAC